MIEFDIFCFFVIFVLAAALVLAIYGAYIAILVSVVVVSDFMAHIFSRMRK